MLSILFLLALVFSTSHVAVQGFCVADLEAAQSPAGYPCKAPASVKVDDFVVSGLRPQNTTNSNFLKFSISPAFVQQLPGLNGLGFAAARLDMEAGGTVPMHSHPDASEMLIMVQGRITAGFISTDNSVFVKTLAKGDVMVLPKGLLHFQINAGKGKATVFLAFSSVNPGAQLVDAALFGNNLDSDLVAKATFLDPAQVKKLKGVFGGSG